MNKVVEGTPENFYRTFIQPGDLCFDIGANIGLKTAVFLKLGARVVAVEPQIVCMNELRNAFGKNENCVLVQKAVGEKKGEAPLFVNDGHILSSMSKDWIDAMRGSGRFDQAEWRSEITVPMITLDILIKKYGVPVFCKIDVEGYESAVLQGLTQPLPSLSFEYAAETLVNAVRCLNRLRSLGDYEFNYSVGENMWLEEENWVSEHRIVEMLESIKGSLGWGDIYARLKRKSKRK